MPPSPKGATGCTAMSKPRLDVLGQFAEGNPQPVCENEDAQDGGDAEDDRQTGQRIAEWSLNEVL